jgi:hypothetical protein
MMDFGCACCWLRLRSASGILFVGNSLRLSPNDDRISINLSQDGDKVSIAKVALFPAETGVVAQIRVAEG